MHAHVPEISGTNEKRNGLYIQFLNGTVFPITLMNGFQRTRTVQKPHPK
jgi:hypothetical protein